ncbi:hypothetical protein jhhlp_005324 [Lomentospora prolificans]|uniref:Uncharacterized protein n=1 Tax=Lomentospora prolificans TaxID=41688 RepID=A0A2N3N7G9_9PEZI|nr:hypothetical protein jhhlp_005324 [Lomentospora prolificans]
MTVKDANGFKTVKKNCSAFIESLETSRWAVLPWERWQVANQFANCTYHELFTEYPDAPDGANVLVWEDQKFSFSPRPEAERAKNYGPGDPLDVTLGMGDEPSPDFLPIFEGATSEFFSDLCVSDGSMGLPNLQFFYDSINIAGSHECNSKIWSFVGVGLSILVEFVHTALKMWLTKKHLSSGFSWLMLLIRLSSGLGEPIIATVILQRSSFDRTSALVIASLEILQPTAAPLISGVAGWYIGKGEGFQVLATDAVITLLGLFLVTPHIALSTGFSQTVSRFNMGLVPLGLLLAIGPWSLAYVVGSILAVLFQLCFIGGMVFRSGKLTEFAGKNLIILLSLLIFIGLTPIWALWELIWKLVHLRRRTNPEWSALKDEKERELKSIFPLARYFKQKFYSTSSWKRGLAIFIFWFFILLSFVSFVGKWMVMVNLLGAAGDAYCPSNFVEATFAGLGFKVAVLAIGLVLQYFNLAA